MTHQKSSLALLLCAMIAVSVLCWWNFSSDNETLKIISSKYPAVDGSTSTHPLSMMLACKIFGITYEWKTPPASERTVFPSFHDNPFKAKFIEDKIKHNGTHTAYMNLAKKKVDLIFVARAPSEREIQAARDTGSAFDVKPIALDALIFIVNKKNRIESLTLSQIRSIYGPESRKAWNELGGAELPIEAFQRDQDSGSQEIFQKLVMGKVPIRGSTEIPIVYTMIGAVHAAAFHENGVAFSVYYYFTNMAQNNSVKLIGINGIKPSSQTIASLEYPLIAEVFAVMRTGMKKESTARMLRDWLVTNKGRNAIRESGYVPIPQK